MTRLSWDEYFIQQCDLIASRGTCPRKQVGSVIVRDKRILSAGYNGASEGLSHCCDIGCDIENNHCLRAVHSEENAICSAARIGVATKDASLYCNTRPCWKCFKLILSAGIKEVVYFSDYKNDPRIEAALSDLPNFIFRRIGKNE